MRAEDVRAYVDRARGAAAALERAHWARELAERGPDALLAVAQGLRERMRSLRPDWPTEEERRRDLAQHVALKRILDRAAGGFTSLTGR
jgi:hypothetical protein